MTREGAIFLQACIKGGNACEWVEDKSLNFTHLPFRIYLKYPRWLTT